MRDDEEVAFQAVHENGCAIDYVSDRLQRVYKIVSRAYKELEERFKQWMEYWEMRMADEEENELKRKPIPHDGDEDDEVDDENDDYEVSCKKAKVELEHL
ncbi:hypothetical protein FDP41_000786 [Naegleria fowleri]|uniref:DUF4116 domain-containing protein n=1 Tax=Naegleria fowleri TaxID=5763 RepID=A0A6A5C6G4_NAEFO|nr:uncharacterized protein FDP41_000786 [Naegleria fowleri]KAF0984887.1 hypothetical protein FDP41_000786 [Naegleria fowleri]CAG4719269.1 unnamed protein product [Naegleria fowleri]